jgi:lambda repressor-like predicted transcriptional regulator
MNQKRDKDMKNKQLRAELALNGIKISELATAMNIKPSTLSHYMMQELNDRQLKRVQKAMEQLKGGKNARRTTEQPT